MQIFYIFFKSVPYLQLLLLVGSNHFEFIVDHRSLRQIQGVCGHRRVGAADPPVQAHGGGETVAGPGHGAEPRGAPGGSAAHARGGDGELRGIPENLPVGGRGVAVSVVHVC